MKTCSGKAAIPSTRGSGLTVQTWQKFWKSPVTFQTLPSFFHREAPTTSLPLSHTSA